MATNTRQCDRCRQPYKRRPNERPERPGTTIRGFCPPCTVKNEAEWRARRNGK